MQPVRTTPLTMLGAVAAAAAVLLVTRFFAGWLENSAVYRQSRILGSIAAHDQVSIVSVLTDAEQRGLLVKFVGAVAAAALHFEMIPYNEGETFAVVFGSLEPGVHIGEFEYRRRDLLIRGTADAEDAFGAFIGSLSRPGYFSSVTGDASPVPGGVLRFEVWCAADRNVPPGFI